MELALQAALLGAVVGCLVSAGAAFFGAAQAAAPKGFAWWGFGFLLDSVARAVLLQGQTALSADLADVIHAFAAGLYICGSAVFSGRSASSGMMAGGLQAALVWAVGVHLLRGAGYLPADMPVFAAGAPAMLHAAWTFRRSAGHRRGIRNLSATVSFAVYGLLLAASPLLNMAHWSAAWGLFAQQIALIGIGFGLLAQVMHRQWVETENQQQRADLLQTRLGDALSSIQDGLALFDQSSRLVMVNDRYRDLMAPAAGTLKPGRLFADVVAAEIDRGAVMGACALPFGSDPAEHALPDRRDTEMELHDGRTASVSVYPTADGGHLRILRDVTAQRQTTESLRESVNWLRGIMETVVDGIVTIDDMGAVLSFNPAAERIFGYTAGEVIGRNVKMLMPEPFQSEHDGYLARFHETGEARVIGIGREVRGRRKDGSEFPLELAVTQMRRGDLSTFIGVVRDITDRKRVENALVDSEQRFRDQAESASDWFWELDRELRFIFVSGRVRQVLGVGPGHFIGRPFSDLQTGVGAPRDWEIQEGLMRARRSFRGFVYMHDRGAGAPRYVEMAGRPSYDGAGQFQGYRGTASDITPLKRHEHELAAQSALRQSIIDNMAQGVAVFDGDEHLAALNHLARSLLDLEEGEIETGMSSLEGFILYLAVRGEFGKGRITPRVRRRLALLRRNPRRSFEHRRPGGQVLEVRSTPLPGGGLIMTFSDVTERKKAEIVLRDAKDAAERGNRAKATFLANISHELRTPLNAIIGFSELMKHEIFGPLEPAGYRGYVDDVHESGMHLLELINDILDMSKAEAGMTDLSESNVDVPQLALSVMRMMEKRAQGNGVVMEFKAPPELPLLRADEKRMRQILLNLASNAVKFTEEGGSVVISADADENGFVLDVADTGIGMSPEDLERVMEPFVQADSRLSRKYEGTGLGLPLTKALVEAHGGSMIIQSLPDQGTTVRAAFPAHRVVRPPSEHDSAIQAMLRG